LILRAGLRTGSVDDRFIVYILCTTLASEVNLDFSCGYVIEEEEPQSTFTGGEKCQSKKQPLTARQPSFPVSGLLGECTFRFKSSLITLTPICQLTGSSFRVCGMWLSWGIALIGTWQQLEKAMAGGEPVELTSDALDFLRQRRAEQIKHDPWVERRYRHGRRFRFGR
jgi:hypothetical protein